MKLPLLPGQRRPLDRSTAWVCVATNQFVTPGLGSMIGGRLWMGLVQFGVAFTGFVFVLKWFFHLFATMFRGDDLWPAMRSHAGTGKLGLALFFIGWLLALGSSVGILRETRRPISQPPPRQPGPPPKLVA